MPGSELMVHTPRAPIISEPERDCEELLEEAVASADERRQQPHSAAVPIRRAFAIAAVLVCGAVVGAVVVARGLPARPPGFLSQDVGAATQLAEEKDDSDEPEDNPCKGYPNLILQGVKHNNLGKKGPMGGEEGIIYHASDVTDPEHPTEVDLEVHAVGPYHPHATRVNGMNGKYGCINIQPGSRVDLKFEVRDRKGKTLKLPKSAITWFDLDTGYNGSSTEKVTAKGFTKYHVTKKTEILTDTREDGATSFSASTFGTGKDNPSDPLKLSVQQINRAVSFEFEKTDFMEFSIAASKGRSPRFFTFAGRPSVLCANVYKDGKLISHGGSFRQGPGALLVVCLLGLLRQCW